MSVGPTFQIVDLKYPGSQLGCSYPGSTTLSQDNYSLIDFLGMPIIIINWFNL